MLSRKTGLWLFWIGFGLMASPGFAGSLGRLTGLFTFCLGAAIIWNAHGRAA